MVRHRGVAMPAMRGVGWAQGIARYIAVGLLVVMPLASAKPSLGHDETSAVGVAPAGVELVERSRSPGTGASSAALTSIPAPDSAAPARTFPCQSRRTPCNAATRSSRSPPNWRVTTNSARWTIANEILDANLDATMADGQRFTNPAYVEPGWALRVAFGAVRAMPARAARSTGAGRRSTGRASYVVEQGDTLWDIADEQLGSGTEWVEIWEENAGDDMGDGRTFDDPDLILPGWELDAARRAARVGTHPRRSTTDADRPVDDSRHPVESPTRCRRRHRRSPTPPPSRSSADHRGRPTARRSAAGVPIRRPSPPPSADVDHGRAGRRDGTAGRRRRSVASHPTRRRRSASSTRRCWPPASWRSSGSGAGSGCVPRDRGAACPSRGLRWSRPNCSSDGSTPDERGATDRRRLPRRRRSS